MREYKLPSGKASIETTGRLLATKEFTVPSKVSERNLALRETLEQCLQLSAQLAQKESLIDEMKELCLTSGEVNEIRSQAVLLASSQEYIGCVNNWGEIEDNLKILAAKVKRGDL